MANTKECHWKYASQQASLYRPTTNLIMIAYCEFRNDTHRMHATSFIFIGGALKVAYNLVDGRSMNYYCSLAFSITQSICF